MGDFRLFLAAVACVLAWVLVLVPAPPAKADMVFRATCGSLKGHRVDMDPVGKTKREDWKLEYYRSGPPPEGQGTLEFVSDDTDNGHIRIKWSNREQALPIVFKSDTQISIADVDDHGVWLFTLFYQAGKVMVTRQTTNPGPGAIGALLVGDCQFTGK